MLGLKFAYAINGHGIVEFDFLTGLERELREFSAPQRFSRNAVGQRGTWWHRMEQFN